MSLSAVSYTATLLSGAVGFMIAFQGQRSVGRWSFAAGMLLLALESVCVGLAAGSAAGEPRLYWENLRMVILALLPAPWLLFSKVYARADESLRDARRFWALMALFLVPLFLAVFKYPALVTLEAAPQTSGVQIVRITLAGLGISLFFLLAAILVMMNLERTFRAAVGTMRWRVKFMVFGLAMLFGVRTYTSSQVLLFRVLDPSLLAFNSVALILATCLIVRSLLRTGHFEVSVYPSQAVIQSSLTLLLSGVYLVAVGVLAKFVSLAGGAENFPLKSLAVLVALVLLAMVLLSDRIRMRMSQLISRHFQRPVHDYRQVWKSFTESTARCVEPKELSDCIVKLLSEVFRCLSVTLWVIDDKKENFTFLSSTALSQTKAQQLRLDPADSAAVMRALLANPAPVDLDSSKEFWASALRRLQPDEFRKGGNRICAPLIAGGELLGLITMGDRVGGMRFGLQDMDLLRSVVDQTAANLLNTQLAQKLSQAKQLEAFQAMSAFFVHDLKNTASTLSLMLQNLPVHYADPAFREDALRGIAKTVTHIRELISRLTVLRHELAIHPVETDLNGLIQQVIQNLSTSGTKTETTLAPLPKIKIDPGQIEKVLTNLLLNAKEAMTTDEPVKIETERNAEWAILKVTDHGCGMTPEFIRNRLFRPFETTKKKGIGIGMFHCKTIVEAHRGRIEVESELGRSTSVKVLLPLN